MRSLAASTVLLLTLAARDARAQLAGRGEPVVQFKMQGAMQWMRSLPTTGVSELAGDARPLEGELPGTGPSTLLTYTSGADLILRDRYVIPLFDVDMARSVGRRRAVYGAVDGSIFELHPWSAWQVGFFFGGIGRRWKHRRWAHEATLQPGFSVTMIETAGASFPEPRATLGVHLATRATAAACRRLDPEHRACLVGFFNVYQQSFLNGGGLGLRWEVGP